METTTMMGKRYFTFIGTGINIIPIFASGYNVAKAATTPKIAPEAPTIGVATIALKLSSNSFCLRMEPVFPVNSTLAPDK